MEIWKTIPIAPCYEASSLGRIRNAANGRVLTTKLRKDGYRDIGLRLGQPKRLWRKVSQLVGEAFLGERPFPKAVVAHEDGSRSNDVPGNLFWKTHKENHADRDRHGRAPKGSRNGNARLREDEVARIRDLLKSGVRQLDIAAQFDVCGSTISHINTDRNWKNS